MDDRESDWAICCSGGGIRSATYCLGALQSLQRGGLYDRVRWIVGVSGGSYIAASLALVRHSLHAEGGEGAAYKQGSAEEHRLRENTRFITPHAETALAGMISLICGVIFTASLFLAPLYVVSHVWGWVLRAQGVLTWAHNGMTASVTAWSWWLAPALVGCVTLILALSWWASPPVGGSGHEAQRAQWTYRAAVITSVLVLAMLVIPPAISWLYHSTGPVATIAHAFNVGQPWRWSLRTFSQVAATISSLIAALVAVAGWCRTQMAKVRAAETQTTSAPGVVIIAARWVISHLVPWSVSAVLVAICMVAALTWVGAAARSGFTPDQLIPVAIAAAITFEIPFIADINRLSLHDVYRWRLSTAYAVTRAACLASDPADQNRLLAMAARTRLSELRADKAPELVICTTANKGVRPGQSGFCLAFDPKHVALYSQPRSVGDPVVAATADYEHLVGHSRLTLFDLVAISGAAVSPLMGSATKVAYRILLTATNVRLGVWLPHPAVVKRARDYLDGEYDQAGRDDPAWSRRTWLLLAWYVLPHPHWRCSPDQSERWEARLWAHMLQIRQDAAEGRWARLGAAISWRFMQPTRGMLWAEAAGHTSYRATWINVTDGGHYDNLGMVEALHRGPTDVLVLDASGDHANTWFTLGRSMAAARAAAGVEISLDPTTMARGRGRLAPGEVHQPWAVGSFDRTVPGPSDSPRSGSIWVCKLGWWKTAPWDVVAYARSHPSYPCQPTRQQLSDSSEFEAYRELGASTVELAGRQGGLPLDLSPEAATLNGRVKTTSA